MNKNVEIVWSNILRCENETFKTVRGISYTYIVDGDCIKINGDKRRTIAKDDIAKALMIVNPRPSKIQDEGIWGPSYVYGIITDSRIMLGECELSEKKQKIALISCTYKKKSYACIASELYSASELFRSWYAYAKHIKADKIYIMSTLYGLVSENDMLKPYEKDIRNMSGTEKTAWVNEIVTKLDDVCDLDNDEIIVLAGKDYYQGIIKHIPNYTIPFAGKNRDMQIAEINSMIR